MKKWQKVLLGSAGLLVAGSLLVACGSNSSKSSSSDSKTLKLWVPTGAKKSYSDTVAQFEKKSGYKVDMVEMEDPNAQENLTKDASTAADVFSLPHDQLSKRFLSNTQKKLLIKILSKLPKVLNTKVKPTLSHMVSKHKLLTITSLSLMKKMLNHMKQSLLKLNLVAT